MCVGHSIIIIIALYCYYKQSKHLHAVSHSSRGTRKGNERNNVPLNIRCVLYHFALKVKMSDITKSTETTRNPHTHRYTIDKNRIDDYATTAQTNIDKKYIYEYFAE